MGTELEAALDWLFQSWLRAKPRVAALEAPPGAGRDEVTRHPEVTGRLLEALGHPEAGLEVVNVAGSKGKGSTASFLASLLDALGARVGLFTGPDLLDYTERIRLDGRAIPPGQLADLILRRLRPAVEALRLEPPLYASPVGLALLAALLWFRQEGATVAVLEHGRGARSDDVNQVPHRWAVLTPVMGEHRYELGPTLERIAWQKAAVVRPETEAAVLARQERVVLEAVEREARSGRGGHPAAVDLAGRDFLWRVRERAGEGEGRLLFDLETPWARYRGLALRGSADFLVENAAVAVRAAERWLGGPLPEEAVRGALGRLRLHGRLEVLERRPLVAVDGAIHPQAAAGALAMLRRAPRPRWLIVGMPQGKELAGTLSLLAPEAETVCLTRARNPYLHFDLERDRAVAREIGVTALLAPDLEAALARGRAAGAATLLIVGTQSLVADALRLYRLDLRRLW
ncbi:MAG: hypothetical protein QJR14_02280 [Bacillota bacterium]|nr:hypothetical protein [Bacillota bacterium]